MTGDRKLPLALTLWWALAILPGMLVVAFGGLDLMGNITGSIMIVWIVGYLAQLAAFMWASRLTGRDNMIGWFIASLAPWAVDWSAPASLRYPIPIAVLVAGYAWWMYRSSAAQKDLAEHGVPAIGTVLNKINDLGIADNTYIFFVSDNALMVIARVKALLSSF